MLSHEHELNVTIVLLEELRVERVNLGRTESKNEKILCLLKVGSLEKAMRQRTLWSSPKTLVKCF